MKKIKKSFRADFILILKGIAMGAANKVPGVSGGIVAFVAGFYEELIYSLQKIDLKGNRYPMQHYQPWSYNSHFQ